MAASCKQTNLAKFQKKVNYIEHHAILLEKLHQAKTNDEKALAKSKEDLEYTKAKLASSITFAEQLMSNGSLTS